MNAADAALVLGVSPRQVTRWLRDGVMAGQRQGSEWEIEPDEVERVRVNITNTLAPMAPELAAAEMLIGIVGAIDGRAMRDAVAHAREIVALAEEWEKRAEQGASGVINNEVRDTLARHIEAIGTLTAALRGTAATYRAVRDHLAGVARTLEEPQDA